MHTIPDGCYQVKYVHSVSLSRTFKKAAGKTVDGDNEL